MAFDLGDLAIFVRVAELASFTRAADALELPKARVSFRVKKLEDELGAQLLQRSTRVVQLTAEGEQLLGRARRLLVDADAVGTMFQAGRSIRGRVRIDLPVRVAHETILPHLHELLARHPELELTISTTDRVVEPFREGFDCVLRVGEARDPRLVGRRLGALHMINCASAGYVRSRGTPRTLDELDAHVLVHYASTVNPEPPSFQYPAGGRYLERPMRSIVTVNSVDAYHALCLSGLGIIQVPRIGVVANLAAGTLVELLPELTCAPLPVSLLHTHGRAVPRRVRAVMSWLGERLAPYLDAQ